MALTRITKGVIKPNENYDTHNINSTGIVTAVGANFTGDVNVGGILTYEDVTSIDSVGIITARNGIDCNGDIDVDGHTNLDNVSVAGVTTFTDDVYFDGATANRDIIFDRSTNTLQVKANAKLKLGQGSYSTDLYTDGTNTFIDHNVASALFVKSNIFQVFGTGASGGNTYDGTILRCIQGKTELGYEVPNGGATTLDNLVTSEKGVTVGTGVTIERNGNSNFVGVSSIGTGATGAVYLYNPADDNLSGTTNDDYGWKAKTYKDGLQVNSKIYLSRSGSNGLQLTYNNATGSYITALSGFLRLGVPYGGYFNIYSNNVYIKNSSENSTFAHFEKVSNFLTKTHLYSQNQIKLSTEPSGVSIVGTTTSTQLAVTGVSTFSGNIYSTGNFIELNNGADSQYALNRGGTQLFSIRNNAASGVHINTQNSALLCFGVSTGTNNGSVESTLSINSSGNVGIDNQLASEKLHLADSKKLALGNSADLKIYHDGSHSYIDESGTGNLYIQSNHVNIDSKNGEQFINCIQDGAVQIYDNNELKLSTNYEGITVRDETSTQSMVKMNTSSGFAGALYGVGNSVIALLRANLQWGVKVNSGGTTELYHTGNAKKLETTTTGISVTGGAVFASTDTGSSAEPELVLYRDSASPADADYLGQIKFNGRSDAGGQRTYAKITGKILDASNTTEDGIIEIAHIKAGSQNISARFRSDSLQLINGTNFTVAGTSSFSDDVSFTTANGGNILIDKSDNSIRLGDSVPMFFGTNKMWLNHNGSVGYLHNVTGSLYIRNEDSSGDIYIQAKSGEHSIVCNYDSDVQLYYDGGIVAQTTQYGFQITNGALDLNNTGGSGASIRCQSAGPFYVGAAAQGDLILYCQDNTNNSVILQANTGEKYIECNMGGSVDLWYHGGLVAKTTQRGLRLTSNLASSGGMANMLQLDNTGNNTGDGSKITFSRAGTIRSEIESIKNETANNETDIVFRNTNAGSLYERLRIFGDGSITQNYANPNASAVFRISKSGGGAAELRFDTATVNTSNLYLGSDEQLRIRYGSTEHTRFTSDGFVGIGQENPKAGLSIRTLGDYSTNDGNTYWIPEGQWSTVWNHANDIFSNKDYWVGFAGGYHQSGQSVNISLAPNRGNLNAQQGMYISGEATAASSSDFAVGKIIGGNQLGISTLASTGKRATKTELFRIKNNGNVGINTSSVDTKLHIVHPSAAEDVLKIEAKPVTADTGAKSKLIFQITQSNNQSARLAEIHSLAEGGWGGGMAFNYKPRNSTPNNTTEEVFRFNHAGNAAVNSRIVFDSYLQMGGYNNTNESFVNLAVMFSARDLAGSSLVSGQSDTMSGYARRRTTSDGNGTFFFGPYGAFPCGDYTALFRMKVSDRSGSSVIGYIDIIGNGIETQGRNIAPRTSAQRIDVQTNDFTESNKYQYFAMDFSKNNSAAHIETRFLSYSSATTDIYLDHILILPRINHGFEGGSGVFDY